LRAHDVGSWIFNVVATATVADVHLMMVVVVAVLAKTLLG